MLRPLPPHLDEGEIFTALDPAKDVEPVHPENAGLLALGTPRFVPSTPASVATCSTRGSTTWASTATPSPGPSAHVTFGMCPKPVTVRNVMGSVTSSSGPCGPSPSKINESPACISYRASPCT